jgi:hypothetical protein
MAKNQAAPGPEILHAALQGLELQREKLDEQIAQVRALLGRKVGRPAKVGVSNAISVPVFPTGGKRVLSSEARKRIAAAQKKRWAAFRKNQK